MKQRGQNEEEISIFQTVIKMCVNTIGWDFCSKKTVKSTWACCWPPVPLFVCLTNSPPWPAELKTSLTPERSLTEVGNSLSRHKSVKWGPQNLSTVHNCRDKHKCILAFLLKRLIGKEKTRILKLRQSQYFYFWIFPEGWNKYIQKKFCLTKISDILV